MNSLRPVTPMSIIAALLKDMMSKSTIGISKKSKAWEELERCKKLANGLDPYLERLSLIHI